MKVNYDYRKALKQDIEDWIYENDYPLEDSENCLEALIEGMFDEDSVTGNGPYGYGSEEELSVYIASNENLLIFAEAMDDFGGLEAANEWWHKNPVKFIDTAIRCHLLWECAAEVLKKLTAEK